MHAPKPRDYEFMGSSEFKTLENELIITLQREVEGDDGKQLMN